MSTVIIDGSVHTTTTTIVNNNYTDLYNNNVEVVTHVDSVIIGTISSIHHHNVSISSIVNASLMGNASMEDTNPRLVNGVVNLILMLLNIGGNGLVLYVYHSLFRNTVFNLFVKALASLDLLTAVTTMLIDVIMKMRNNHEDRLNTNAMCKMSHFQVYANSMASGCVLTLIAYQRYRKICHPLQRGMQLRQGKILLVCICVACMVISIPTLFLYGSRHVRVLVRSTEVNAIICRANQSYQDTPLNLVFYYVLMIAFCLVLGSVCILYFMVSRSIRKFEKRSSAILNPSSPMATTPQDRDRLNDEDDDDNYRRCGTGGYHASPMTTRTIMTSPVHGRNPMINNNNAIVAGSGAIIVRDPYQGRRAPNQSPLSAHAHNAAGRSTHRAPSLTAKDGRSISQTRKLSTFTMATTGNIISTQMYRVFSIITVVFIISYLPHLVALILTKVLDLDNKVLTHGQRIALEFAYNCPYISTVSNPIIYGFSSSEFRDRVREMLQSCDVFCCCCVCCCCCCDGGDGEGCRCPCCEPFDCCDEYACCNED